jgi:hypothetical protein
VNDEVGFNAVSVVNFWTGVVTGTAMEDQVSIIPFLGT